LHEADKFSFLSRPAVDSWFKYVFDKEVDRDFPPHERACHAAIGERGSRILLLYSGNVRF